MVVDWRRGCVIGRKDLRGIVCVFVCVGSEVLIETLTWEGRMVCNGTVWAERRLRDVVAIDKT